MTLALPLMAALALGTAPKVGDLAPDFTAKDTDGNTVTLSTMLKDGPVVLAFFPKAFTPG
jgi:peroxiredoxin